MKKFIVILLIILAVVGIYIYLKQQQTVPSNVSEDDSTVRTSVEVLPATNQ